MPSSSHTSLHQSDRQPLDSRTSTDDVPLSRMGRGQRTSNERTREQLFSDVRPVAGVNGAYTRYRDDVDEEAEVGLPSGEQARMDEETMRRANQDVAMLQQQMIDRRSSPL